MRYVLIDEYCGGQILAESDDPNELLRLRNQIEPAEYRVNVQVVQIDPPLPPLLPIGDCHDPDCPVCWEWWWQQR
jgi:hypothetical protein